MSKLSGAVGVLVVTSVMYLGHINVSAMRESPEQAFLHQSLPLNGAAKLALTPIQVRQFLDTGLVVIDNVLTEEELALARSEVDKMLSVKGSKRLFSTNENDDETVRRDIVSWIAESFDKDVSNSLGPGLLHALRCVRSIPFSLCQSEDADTSAATSTGIGAMSSVARDRRGLIESNMGVPFSNQLAVYDGNKAHYVPHRDTPEVSDTLWTHPLSWLLQSGMEDRRVTVILYLNDKEWNSSAGGLSDSGNLRCYIGADLDDMTGHSSTSTVDIQPCGGRMIVFDSRTLLHEVRPSSQRRVAITCWAGGSHSHHLWLRPLSLPWDQFSLRRAIKGLFL